jgi:hypothetical protein
MISLKLDFCQVNKVWERFLCTTRYNVFTFLDVIKSILSQFDQDTTYLLWDKTTIT